MSTDSITDEIRRIRHDLAAQFGDDLDSILADIRRREAIDGRTYVSLSPRRIPKTGRTKRCMGTVGTVGTKTGEWYILVSPCPFDAPQTCTQKAIRQECPCTPFVCGSVRYLGRLPADGTHVVAILKAGLFRVKYGDHSAVGKLHGAGIAHIAAGLK